MWRLRGDLEAFIENWTKLVPIHSFWSSYAFGALVLNFIFQTRKSPNKSVKFWWIIMAKIKLFYNVQKYFKALGFHAPLQPNKHCPVNRRNGFFMFTLAGMIIPTFGFLLFKAKSAFEYSNTFYISITLATAGVAYIIYLYRMKAIINLIENCQEFIEKRKCWITKGVSFYSVS